MTRRNKKKVDGIEAHNRKSLSVVLITQKPPPNPLSGWQVDSASLRMTGQDLARPECILAERDGSLWVADARGGIVHIAPGGMQHLVRPSPVIEGSLPNGLAFARNGDLLIANFGSGVLESMTRAGQRTLICDEIDGVKLGRVNFVLRDRRGRLWMTVSTQSEPWTNAISNRLTDGYIALQDATGWRIVADGLAFANEIRFDDKEEFLYVAETCARRVTRLRLASNGSLRQREIFGPASLGSGAVDGIAFDAYGNLWATMIFSDRLVAITPGGDLLTLLDSGDPAAAAGFDAELDSGAVVRIETMEACSGKIAPWLTSITFGGPDLRTAYLGSVKGRSIPYFDVPVAGLPMVHWHET